jgi:hypothetical protein
MKPNRDQWKAYELPIHGVMLVVWNWPGPSVVTSCALVYVLHEVVFRARLAFWQRREGVTC